MDINQPILGIDIGGTNIKAGILRKGELSSIKSFPTPALENTETIFKKIFDLISTYSSEEFHGIGIGVPGLVELSTGKILSINNIPSLINSNLKNYLETQTNLPVKINNDANCFVMGAYRFGNLKHLNNVVGISLGTGLGAGIITNKNLYSGLNAAAGEWSAIPYLDKTFEDYCSSKFFSKEYNQTADKLAHLATKGENNAIEAFQQFGIHLAELIKHILYTLSPEGIILGGSISKSHNLFLDSLKCNLKNCLYPSLVENLTLHISDINEPGIIGAASLHHCK
ncbi:transcriptional regulator/sugar kinase [Belliella baltica DSM 15883]|uniref:Transcriptional regulator/sugar kinase n=1 Tax=Belliella baltica (strain DSM 15883 / CIP 108006 / LMG 21964 / BA134) TaxID=866536 RepID=I3Z946_BELBD|nr:ROK family protein [Belliella baltica]AFL85764.1 transcriptional regulator/sugar kinase [Belliella baltica DSM 15883]